MGTSSLLTHFHSGRGPIVETYRLFQSSLKTPVCLLSLFQCSECQKLSTLTVTNVINPQGHRLHADVAKGSVIKLKQYSQDAPTKAGGTRLISTAEKTKEQVAVCEAPFCSLWILPWYRFYFILSDSCMQTGTCVYCLFM